MKMTLERSNSAETFSPPGGDTELRLLSLWDVWVGWCVDFFFAISYKIGFLRVLVHVVCTELFEMLMSVVLALQFNVVLQ